MQTELNTSYVLKESMVSMRDGVRLYTKLYFPKNELESTWPVIVIRDPYGNKNPNMVLASEEFAQNGYAVVLQHCRGTAGSEGEWIPHVNERNDGIDTLNWVAKQPWMNGNIGTFGLSYRGFTQWAEADQLPLEVKTMVIAQFGLDRYKQMYQDGMFRMDLITSWAVRNSGIKSEHDIGYLYKKALGIRPHIEMDMALYGVEMPWYRDLIQNVNSTDEFWNTGVWPELLKIPPKMSVPALFLAGWFDYYLPMMLDNIMEVPKEIKDGSHLQIFPVAHGFSMPGDLSPFPNSRLEDKPLGLENKMSSELKIMPYALEWFEYKLKGKSYSKPIGGVEAYVIGSGEWKLMENWPPKHSYKRFYLATDEVKGYKGGKLSEKADERASSLTYVYDPDNPFYAKGADSVFAYLQELYKDYSPMAGPVLQDLPGSRSDVLTFISEPFEEEATIAGNIVTKLSVKTNVEDTSFTVKVIEIRPNGEAYNIRNSITSLAYRNGAKEEQEYTAGTIVDIRMELRPIAWKIQKGSRIRLDISSSNFPEYNVHLNNRGPWSEQQRAIKASQTVYFGNQHNSYIEIPIESK